MTYYVEQLSNKIFWYADDGSQDAYIKAGLTKITDEEAQTILNQPRTPVEADYIAAAQNLLDTGAQSKGYDSMLSLASYVTSSNATFKAQAAAGIAWRDAVWTEGYSVLAQIKAGTMTAPTLEAFLALMPVANWPT